VQNLKQVADPVPIQIGSTRRRPLNTLKGSDGRDVIGAHLARESLSAKRKPIAKPTSGWQVDRPGAKAR
jgi:hypothetical protein